MEWRIHHRAETDSTNSDARRGRPGDVYVADFQRAGRCRLDHRWVSPRGANLLMSAVLPAGGGEAAEVATFPLAAGLAVCRAVASFAAVLRGRTPMLKWPNDVLLDDRKIAGILCERHDDSVIAGIGVNVKPQTFSDEIAPRADFLGDVDVAAVRDAVLRELDAVHAKWLAHGFASIHPELAAFDRLRGRQVSVRQADDDAGPVVGLCEGIAADGALILGGSRIYAGEAHVEGIGVSAGGFLV